MLGASFVAEARLFYLELAALVLGNLKKCMPQPPGQVSAHPESSHVGRIARMVSHGALPGGKRGYHELVGTTLYMYIFLRYVCKQSLAPLLSCYSTLAG